MITEKEITQIGWVRKTHGIHGELSIEFGVEVDFDACDYFVFDMDGIFVPFFIDEMRFKSETTAFVLFDGIKNETQAREFCGKNVYAKREFVPEQITGTLTYVVGSTVAVNGEIVGKIEGLDVSTENILLIVGNKLIPYNHDLIEKIDADNSVIYMNFPEGLLDL